MVKVGSRHITSTVYLATAVGTVYLYTQYWSSYLRLSAKSKHITDSSYASHPIYPPQDQYEPVSLPYPGPATLPRPRAAAPPPLLLGVLRYRWGNISHITHIYSIISTFLPISSNHLQAGQPVLAVVGAHAGPHLQVPQVLR